jgi:hypothetical protein
MTAARWIWWMLLPWRYWRISQSWRSLMVLVMSIGMLCLVLYPLEYPGDEVELTGFEVLSSILAVSYLRGGVRKFLCTPQVELPGWLDK